MTKGWIFAFLFMTISESTGSSDCSEEVDLIELNHFHDCLGRHVYDQVIFYDWSVEWQRYHVRAWCLVEDREPISRRPVRSYSDNRYRVQWYDRDQNLSRNLSSKHYHESWTQVDPERANKKLLDERLRIALVKRTVEQPKPTIEPTEPTEGSADVDVAQQEEAALVQR